MNWEAGVAATGNGSASAKSRGALLHPERHAHSTYMPTQDTSGDKGDRILWWSTCMGPHREGIVIERPRPAGVPGNLWTLSPRLLMGISVSCRADLPNLLLGCVM